MEDCSFHAGHEFDDSNVAYVLNEPVDDVIPELAMRHLASTEAQAGLHLVAIIQEADCLVLLGLVVMLIHCDGELDFLDHDDFLLFTGSALAFFLFVEIASVVLNAADGRNSVG